jgi:hypothetical protein
VRSIIRFSVDGEGNGKLRNRLAKILTDAGYVLNRKVTATWEAEISAVGLASAMQAFWAEANNPPAPGVKVDHVWMYADNPPAGLRSSGEVEVRTPRRRRRARE